MHKVNFNNLDQDLYSFTLKNNLKSYDFNKVLEVLKKYNYDENVRAEALPIDVFIEISNNL